MTIYKSRCYNGGKQHKFRPRYSEKPNLSFARIKAVTSRDFIYYKEYLFDICEWCGKKIIK